ncbi:divergent polysaccharide deacetylase family protein [Bradyrhizobium sp. 83012]|uniref:Divergent polysaccharide deacetylase family protein n=1 Tax=Bradyrhizobium aeschynomenes TaxID=2734909 RepID=A0ABX2CHX1_9BRAD|nr:divergent polysaccharide deacetylase family protein [Bradyrhizobium aeschynomenes]NPU67816.1 divergent polysaccharide deacetylase family protein [Bradyrhizobium aeschynomenes]NPV23978.1 divergent polysaccharide deacetylase family protein [Bradyrhizobium aeschynomenes]
MTETADELSAPLGQTEKRRRRRIRLPFTALQALAMLLGLFLVVFAGFAMFSDNPLGGEPVARVAINEGAKSDDKPAATKPEAKPDHGAAPAAKSEGGERKTVTIIDGSSGARQEVAIGPAGSDTAEPGAAAPGSQMPGVDPRLLEKSRYGMIPVMADGVKPFTAYAADADRAKAARMPAVAIVIGGLGVGAAKTVDAIMKLPPAVTLAFTPYGADPTKLAERARAQRHEILLQVPMEPYDYPDNDPGPQTLLATLGPDQNIDRLFWHMSRLQGYVGIGNFMGARFVATEAAMQPIVNEAAKRGLALFDDGAAPRSVAASLATGRAMPFAKGDVAIDAVPTPVEIDNALTKLESLAKERGVAVGTASALPVSIDRIGTWIKGLDRKGILLVPLTTAMLKSKSN